MADQLSSELERCPFATVHRSIRADLKCLVKMGWLQSVGSGRYQCYPPHQWPCPPGEDVLSMSRDEVLRGQQSWDLLRLLESIVFVQPQLEPVIQSLWEQLNQTYRLQEPEQRIFLHVDYVLPDTLQELVDTYQEQLGQLWQKPEGGVIQFKYWITSQKKVEVKVYPVCLHYVRRAKYLSAYGLDPYQETNWHNYRLDRIASSHLKILGWEDPRVPQKLKEMKQQGELPTSEEVQQAMDEAWGFNFYLDSSLLIMRYPPEFAHWYVENTVRHTTFKRVAYSQLPQLIRKYISNPEEQELILELLKCRSSQDKYYRAWIRVGDINLTLRLRDWRPMGEVIAPLTLRQQMRQEAEAELKHYDL